MSNSKKKNYKKRKPNAHIKQKVHVNVKEETPFQKFMNEWLWLVTLVVIIAVIASLIIFIPMCSEGGACYIDCSKNEAVVTPSDADDPNAPASFTDQLALPANGEKVAVFDTTAGTFKIRLFRNNAPMTVDNFTNLIQSGYYDGVTFHRVIDGFMVQTGDPTGTGSGGDTFLPGALPDENDNGLYHFRYAVSMANTGAPNSATSQFFIVQSDNVFGGVDETGKVNTLTIDQLITQMNYDEGVANLYNMIGGTPILDAEARVGTGVPAHTVFGQVFEGVEVIDAIAAVETNENDKPLEDIIINKAYVENYSMNYISDGDGVLEIEVSGSNAASPADAQ